MEINEYHGWYNISNRYEPVRYIVVHYVGSGTSAPGNARNNCIYFSGGNRNASANYFIDDGGIWEYADPDDYYTWHVGDGHGMYGITNSNSVGIEVCQDGDQAFTPNEIGLLTQLVGHLMGKYNVPAERVVRHYDASRKQCPYWYAGTGIRQQRWNELWRTITQGDEIVTPEDKEQIAQMAADRVVNYPLNGVLLRDRIIGTDTAANNASVKAETAEQELTRTDDPTGRGVEMKLYDHIKHLAAAVAENNALLHQLVDK